MNRMHKYALIALLIGGARLLVPQEMNPMSGGQQQYQQNQQDQNQQDQIQNQIQNQIIQQNQNQQDNQQAAQGAWDNTPLYRIQVVGREVPAINYMHRRGKTEIGFRGTSLLSKATGHATVDALAGRTMIHANFYNLVPANSFGRAYLTYVLWAITPEGRPVNLGEVLPTGKKDENEITVSTSLQAFGLIVTAEPYFAVTMPSNLVTVENYVLKKTKGMVEQITVHYALLPRGAYEQTAGLNAVPNPITRDMRSPLELYQADNAVRIAEAAGASQYAPDTMAAAQKSLDQANQSDRRRRNRKQTITYARAAVQTAEDARLITIRKLREANIMASQLVGAQAAVAAAQAQQLVQQQAAARAAAEQARMQAQQQQQQALLATAQARQQQMAAQQQTAAARQAQLQALLVARQAQASRERLRQQLSQVMQTKETARGLIMDMPNVQFAFNKYELKPDAQVKLAKVSGILLAYPDLRVQVEGYTDNVGSAEYNQKLSEQRADSVRGFLVAQNVRPNNVTAQGYGEMHPVADNSTDSGRAENRRVQLVISGASIGVPTGGSNSQQQSPSGQNMQPGQNPASPER